MFKIVHISCYFLPASVTDMILNTFLFGFLICFKLNNCQLYQISHNAVTFDIPPDASSIENATAIEAINYFVEMELERYLEKIRLAKAREEAAKDRASEKNTVVALPKIQR